MWEFVGELRDQRPTSISVVADWINTHVPPGSSVCVVDSFHAYPLMIRATNVIYAWQLKWPPEPQFMGMSKILFFGELPVDYFIAFGPGRKARGVHGINEPLGRALRVRATLDQCGRPYPSGNVLAPVQDGPQL